VAILVAAEAIAQSTSDCNPELLRGLYGVQRNGHNTSGTFTSSVGAVTFDGFGRFTGREIVSTNGAFSKSQIDNGYAVNSDCTGTITDANGTAIYKIAVAHGGEEAFGMSIVAGSTEAIHFERAFDHPTSDSPQCTASSFRGAYLFQRNGRAGQSDLLAVGVLMSDGGGTASASQTTGRNGVFNSPGVITGTYTIDPDCMGAQYMNGVEFSALVVVHDGGQILGISETPTNNVVIHFERVKDPVWHPIRPPCGPRNDPQD
jgi:hypothetical protein